ncbi:MAG TPA: ArsR family transcriptional regulator [Planktothrix sp.]
MKKISSRILKRRRGESARQGVMRVLKLRGEATAAELSKAMNITYTAVRRHLSSLQNEGLITSHTHQQGAGRPIYKYRLTEAAAAHFPSGYEAMAANLLDTVFDESGHTGIMDVLRLNNNRLFAMLLPRFINKNLAERVEEIARYYAENGYMTEWTALPDGNFFLYHQNCAIYKLALRYRQLCILEPRLIESLLGVKVSRQQYILKNAPICGYLVDSKRPLSSPLSL